MIFQGSTGQVLFKKAFCIAVMLALTIPGLANNVGKMSEISQAQETVDITGILDYEGETGLVPWHYMSQGLVDLWSGNLFMSNKDMSLNAEGFNLALIRSYNSLHRGEVGPFGRGWTSIYDSKLILNPDNSVVLVDWDGSTVNYSALGGGDYLTPAGRSSRLTHYDTNYAIWNLDGSIMKFNVTGRLIFTENNLGNKLTLSYTGFMLTGVADDSGQSLTFTYGPGNCIDQVTDSTGRQMQYTYDSATETVLESFTDMDGQSILYGSDPADPGLLIYMVDRTDRVLEFSYIMDMGEKKISKL